MSALISHLKVSNFVRSLPLPVFFALAYVLFLLKIFLLISGQSWGADETDLPVFEAICLSGPSCLKLTMSNVPLKLLSLNLAYTLIFLLKKKDSHFFSKNICELDIVLTRTVNILTTNELVKLTMLWITGPSWLYCTDRASE